MKINPAAAYQYYKAYQAAGAGEQPVQKQGASAGKTDTVSISGKAVQNGTLARLPQDIASQVETSVSPSRMAALKQAIENNEYRIPTEQLADSLLGAAGTRI